MRRSLTGLMLAAALLAGCASQPAAQAPTAPAAATAPTPAPTPTADPAIAAARSHILAALTALQVQADAATAKYEHLRVVYPSDIQPIQQIIDDEVAWLNTQPARVLEIAALRDYKVRLLAYQPLSQETLQQMSDGTASATQIGSAIEDLLLIRTGISAIAAPQPAAAAPPTPTPAPTPATRPSDVLWTLAPYLRPTPVPTPTVTKVGEAVMVWSGAMSYVSVAKYEKRQTCSYTAADPGKTLVGVAVAYQAIGDGVFYNPLDWVAHDQANRQYEVAFSTCYNEPLGSGTLLAGRYAVGMILFEVPSKTTHLWVDFRATGDSWHLW
jgi:hypothetical protein